MKKIFFLSIYVLLFGALAKAADYYSDPLGGNFNGVIWSTNPAGPFNIAGTAITTADDVFLQGGTVAINVAAPCRNMTVQNTANATITIATTFAGTVTIQNGGIIQLGPTGGNTGSLTVQSLIINQGGKLWGNDPVNSGATNVKTIRINGNTLQCDGVIGDGSNNDALLIQTEGTTVTISGTGSIDVSRIRKGAATNATTNLIIDANITCRFGTTCVYNNQNSTTYNITINAGKSLKCIGVTNPTGFPGTEGSISLNGTTGGSNRRQGLITVNGLLECDNVYVAATSATGTDVYKYLVTNGGILKVNTQLKGNSATATTTATADLELQSGALLQLGGTTPTASIDGSGSKNKFLFDENSTVEYFGNAQIVESNFGAYRKLIVNTNGTINANSDINITNTLALQNGILGSTNNNTINVSNSASNAITATNSSSFISTKLNRFVDASINNYFFPVGKSGAAWFSISNLSIATNIVAEYLQNAHPIPSNAPLIISTTGYWNIESTNAGTFTGNINLEYTGSYPIIGVSNPSQLSTAFFNGTNWSNLGQSSNTGNATAGNITSSFSNLGLFAWATTTTALPATITKFSYNTINDKVNLLWLVSDEINVSRYEIEKSINGIDFSKIGQVKALNNAIGGNTYSFRDNVASSKVAYRLKIVDNDGSYKWSTVLRINYTTQLPLMRINQQTNNSWSVFINETASILVYNSVGKLVYSKLNVKGNINLSNYHLPYGHYYITAFTSIKSQSFTIVK